MLTSGGNAGMPARPNERGSTKVNALRVVLVDDDRAFRELTNTVLSETGHFSVVGQATNGRDAVTVVRDSRPDLVLLDLEMPLMDGPEALAHLREADPSVAVVIVSGAAPERVARAAHDGGARGFVLKDPTYTIELVEALEALYPAQAAAC
jgi:DNA-binding NarL/FixJ family response regulator